MKPVYLSVVVPFYNEKNNLVLLHEELLSVLERLSFKSEIVYIDDGSVDGSGEIDFKKHPLIHFSIIRLRFRRGQTAAISAGIDHSRGEIIGIIDSDLQNDPHDFPKLLDVLDSETDAVFGWRRDRQDQGDRVTASRLAHFLVSLLFKVNIRDLGGNPKVIRRKMFENLHLYGENHRLLPLLLALHGAKYKEIPVSHRSRTHDKSKYGYTRVLKLLVDIITTGFLDQFSIKPAYVFGTGGLICLGLAIPAFMQVVYKKIFLGVFVHLNPMFIIAMILSLIGVQLVFMGLLAELMVRVYFESRQKPIYEIKDIKDL